VDNLDLRQNGRVEDRTGDLWNAVAGAAYRGERLDLNLEVSRSRSSQTRDNLNIADTSIGGISAEYDGSSAGVGSIGFFGNGNQLDWTRRTSES